MTSIGVLENKISAVKKYLKIIEFYKKFSLSQIENDLTLKGALERYLYLAIQETIELAEAVISLKNFRKPSTYRESFYILEEEKIISKPLSEKLVKMVGFRNFITHDYEKADFKIVYNALKKGTEDMKNFLKAVQKKFRI